ncbi:MAG TPA: FAD:protein FMN transferase [Acidimicrobiales bacterium]|nr:FAD:protein FMN transferase [Acidimicrobiales bacterium]
MGTVVTFDVCTPAPPEEVQAALDRCVAWLHWVDETFSTYKPTSEVCRFDRGELKIADCSDELRHVIALCHRFNEGTGGYFDAWASGHFDPSGVVKGWSIERASSMLAADGLPDHALDGGGDVRLSRPPASGKPWQVAVRHPLKRDAYCAVLSLHNGAVATSGTYERGAHVIDPFAGGPATELVSATVVGPDLTTADAYATAAIAMGAAAPSWLETLSGYEALVISPTGRGWSTPRFDQLSVTTLGSRSQPDGG